MKIGILTFHNADNYGAVLQCYALQEHLKKIYPNDEVYVIDYRNSLIERSYKPICLRKSLKQNVTQFLHLPHVLKCRTKFKDFRKKYFNIGRAEFSDYDIIYYGSDQIWNPEITGEDLMYFGKGFHGKKIAYGVSDGGELTISDEIRTLLNSFDKILCREESLLQRLKNENISAPVETVCDPVFLLSKDQWKKFARTPIQKKYILAYMMANRIDFNDSAEKIGKILHKKVVQIVYIKALKKIFYKKQKIVECITPEQFVGYIANSNFVLTTSFHGTAFSILFEKPFYVLSFERRAERIKDLLKERGLESCFVNEIPADIEIANKV